MMANKNQNGVSSVNTFKNNHYRKIMVGATGVYSIRDLDLDMKFSDIRIKLEGNTYHEITASTPILYINIRISFDSSLTAIDYLVQNPQDLGIIKMKNEIVSDSAPHVGS
jgi:hypothetical protein